MADTSELEPEPPAATLDACRVLKALAHPARLAIVGHLMEGEKAVGEIERALALRQPSLSQQLRHLREAGVLATRRSSKSVYYRVADPRAAALARRTAELFAADETAPVLPDARARPASRERGADAPPCAPTRPRERGECAVFPVTGHGRR